MATTLIASGWIGRLTALSAELTGSGYGRIPCVVNYDPESGSAEILPGGYSFTNTGGSAWAASMYEAVFDAVTGGNILMYWPVLSIALAAGGTLTQPNLSAPQWGLPGPKIIRRINLPVSRLGPLTLLQSGAELGFLAGQSVLAGVPLTYTPAAGTLAAT